MISQNLMLIGLTILWISQEVFAHAAKTLKVLLVCWKVVWILSEAVRMAKYHTAEKNWFKQRCCLEFLFGRGLITRPGHSPVQSGSSSKVRRGPLKAGPDSVRTFPRYINNQQREVQFLAIYPAAPHSVYCDNNKNFYLTVNFVTAIVPGFPR